MLFQDREFVAAHQPRSRDLAYLIEAMHAKIRLVEHMFGTRLYLGG